MYGISCYNVEGTWSVDGISDGIRNAVDKGGSNTVGKALAMALATLSVKAMAT